MSDPKFLGWQMEVGLYTVRYNDIAIMWVLVRNDAQQRVEHWIYEKGALTLGHKDSKVLTFAYDDDTATSVADFKRAHAGMLYTRTVCDKTVTLP